MKVLLNSFNDGSTFHLDIPCPEVSAGKVLIKSQISLISSGTERMLVEFGKANLVKK